MKNHPPKLYLFLSSEEFSYDEETDEEPKEKRALQRVDRERVTADNRQLPNTVRDGAAARRIRKLQLDLERLKETVKAERSRVLRNVARRGKRRARKWRRALNHFSIRFGDRVPVSSL